MLIEIYILLWNVFGIFIIYCSFQDTHLQFSENSFFAISSESRN